MWAVHDGEKVEQDDLSHPAKASNTAWDGHTIKLFGARNEIVAFQVIVEAGEQGIDSLAVSLDELRQEGGSASIRYAPPSEDPTDYVGRPIALFSEHYMNVTEPTKASWITEPNKASSPPDMLGRKPVQLVPENARAGRGGFPLQVEARHNQAVWVDLYVGKDLPAGTYRGQVRVQADGGSMQVPVELEVFDFALPDENSLHYMLYYEPSQVQRYHGANLDDRYHRMAHRFRVEFVQAHNEQSARANIGRFDGAHFSPQHGYEGPGQGVGNTLIPRTMYGPGSTFDTQASAWSASDQWMQFLNDTLPGKITLLYMPDEPSSSQYPYINQVAGNVHSNPGPGGKLPVFVTRSYTSQLDEAIDVWCSSANHFSESRAATERSHGDDLWYYNGQRPHIGSLIIDSPATDARVHGWGCFKHDIPVYFYWHVNHWQHNNNAPSGYERQQDVWANPLTFMNRSDEWANGDGVLVYPGQEVLHPQQDRGIAGPIATIQLANLRRGAQDQAYLALARSLGLESQVQQALDAVVPRVFADCTGAVCFPEQGDAYEQARRALAEAIAKAAQH